MFNNNQISNKKSFGTKFLYGLFALNKHSQKGTTLVVATVMGMMVIGAAGLAMAKANSEKTNTIADEQTKQAIAVAETGISRIQGLFIQEPRLALALNKEQWQEIVNDGADKLDGNLNELADSASTQTSCNSNQGTNSKAQQVIDSLQAQVLGIPDNNTMGDTTQDSGTPQGWVSLDDKRQYQLISYGNNDGIGTLAILGKVGGNNGSMARIKVEFDASLGGSTAADNTKEVPGLWITDVGNDWARDKVNGDIKIFSCKTLSQITGAPDEGNLYDEDDQSISVSSEAMPDTPNLPSSYYTVEGSVSGMTFPRNGTPAVPAKEAVYSKKGDLITPAVPAIPASQGDAPDAKGYYHYLIDNLDINGGSNVTIKDNAKVIFYVRGNINLSGNPDINPSAVNTSANLQIYGNTYTQGNKTKYGCGSLAVGSQCPTLQAHFNGTGTVKAFVHAPAAVGSVNGGGNTNGNFKGSMWIKSWDSSSGNSKVKVDAVGTYSQYLGSDKRVTKNTYTIGNISNWQREKV
ncbi:MAG: hypothetical protein GW834_15030, partial [Cyanobacteria bacterium]|nr:hypothetical protein [Cyanobacteria bacterium CG_2015-09_32_10]